MFSLCSGHTTGRDCTALNEFVLGGFWSLELKSGDAVTECFPEFWSAAFIISF